MRCATPMAWRSTKVLGLCGCGCGVDNSAARTAKSYTRATHDTAHATGAVCTPCGGRDRAKSGTADGKRHTRSSGAGRGAA